MAILITTTMVTMQVLLSQQAISANVINTAGMQRMLSQKAALLLGNEFIKGQQNKFFNEHAFLETIERMRVNHAFLVERNGQGYVHLSPALIQLYFQQPSELERQVESYLEMQLEAHSLVLANQLNIEKLQQINERSQQLLLVLDQAVTLHEEFATSKVTTLQNAELLIWIFGLLILAIEIRWIFYPMEVSIKNKISHLQRLRQESNRLKHSKGEFLARASHEMRTPLQAILGYLHLFQETKQQSHLDVVSHSAQQLHVLLSSIDDYNALSEQKSIKLENKVAKLSDTVALPISTYKGAAENKKLGFQSELGDELLQVVECDHNRVAWLLGELLNNAVKFTEKGAVRVVAHGVFGANEQASLVCEISDTGPGISSIQKHDEDTKNYQGMQLGLARARLLVSMMGGQLVFNDCEPCGTKVRLELPVKLILQKRASFYQQDATQKVLLVEDNLLNARIVISMLEKLKLSVVHTINGQEAISALQNEEFSLVIMDLNMPIMDGFLAIKLIRQSLGLELPILVLTANTSEQSIARVYELGANTHLFKPVDFAALQEKVEVLLLPTALSE
ncbi:hybrid sensor histidine kinase/response regulator [Pseudoalteromonas luteoviolacea]|uniref:hybrid sensor histidine kinase/response regulator n=1 Tax=Pseudoalteromonas luteoviolacea TaxID=43657 RepID=UPI001153C997|nr:response regulator [Pseudoalteromonas luteoviolacea]TQF72861.1 response regulator [Pseudoalteromonas luteoviolacea]